MQQRGVAVRPLGAEHVDVRLGQGVELSGCVDQTRQLLERHLLVGQRGLLIESRAEAGDIVGQIAHIVGGISIRHDGLIGHNVQVRTDVDVVLVDVLHDGAVILSVLGLEEARLAIARAVVKAKGVQAAGVGPDGVGDTEQAGAWILHVVIGVVMGQEADPPTDIHQLVGSGDGRADKTDAGLVQRTDRCAEAGDCIAPVDFGKAERLARVSGRNRPGHRRNCTGRDRNRSSGHSLSGKSGGEGGNLGTIGPGISFRSPLIGLVAVGIARDQEPIERVGVGCRVVDGCR